MDRGAMFRDCPTATHFTLCVCCSCSASLLGSHSTRSARLGSAPSTPDTPPSTRLFAPHLRTQLACLPWLFSVSSSRSSVSSAARSAHWIDSRPTESAVRATTSEWRPRFAAGFYQVRHAVPSLRLACCFSCARKLERLMRSLPEAGRPSHQPLRLQNP